MVCSLYTYFKFRIGTNLDIKLTIHLYQPVMQEASYIPNWIQAQECATRLYLYLSQTVREKISSCWVGNLCDSKFFHIRSFAEQILWLQWYNFFQIVIMCKQDHDHIYFIYLSLSYCYVAGGLGMHYHSMNTMCGIDRFLDFNTFSNPANGYLFNNTCVFGVEVFVVKKRSRIERCLSLIDSPATDYHTWKVTNFSSLVDKEYSSEPFGGCKWY